MKTAFIVTHYACMIGMPAAFLIFVKYLVKRIKSENLKEQFDYNLAAALFLVATLCFVMLFFMTKPVVQ